MSSPGGASFQPADSAVSASLSWNFLTRIVFRFCFVYLLLYCLPYSGRPSLLDAVPLRGKPGEFVAGAFDSPWHVLCPWVAIHIFRLSGSVTQYHPTGSGDTTLDYVQVFCFFVIACLATVVWSILDRRRPGYQTLFAWLRLIVRFTLAVSLLSYGFAKVFPLQFGTPSLAVLTETYGESSPMRVLWTFMAASTGYTMFAGFSEVSAGLLLLFRRTSSLGALVAATVFLNIVMLNFCYDVPVKLYSAHLLLMSLFLLSPDIQALYDFVIRHRAAQLRDVSLPRWERRWLRLAGAVLQILIIAGALYGSFWGALQFSRQRASEKASALRGAWQVARITSPSSDQSTWQQFLFENQFAVVRRANEAPLFFRTEYDDKSSAVKLSSTQSKSQLQFRYQRKGKDTALLTGGSGAQIELRRAKPFLLTTRGFHWISEYPYNR